MAKREVSKMRTAIFKLCGHASIGPRGVLAQSNSRTRCPNAPPPGTQLSAVAARVSEAAENGDPRTLSTVARKSLVRSALVTAALAFTDAPCCRAIDA